MPKFPLWFKIWFGICAAFGLAGSGVAIWAVVSLVEVAKHSVH